MIGDKRHRGTKDSTRATNNHVMSKAIGERDKAYFCRRVAQACKKRPNQLYCHRRMLNMGSPHGKQLNCKNELEQ